MELLQRLHDWLIERAGVEADKLSVYAEAGELDEACHACPDPSFTNSYQARCLIREFNCQPARVRTLLAAFRAFAKQYQQCGHPRWRSGVLVNGVADIVLELDLTEHVEFTVCDPNADLAEFSAGGESWAYDPSELEQQAQADVGELGYFMKLVRTGVEPTEAAA